MTQEQINRILRQMELVRELSYEAESAKEERRLIKEYERLWKSIEPYVNTKSLPRAENVQ